MDVKEQIKRFIIDELMHGEVHSTPGDDDSLLEQGVLDSLGLMRVLEFLRDEYHLTIDDEEVVPENFQSINAIATFVDKRRPGPAG